MKLYNTKTKKIDELIPINPPTVTFYTCGPTVYDYTHIGHLRTFTNNDLLKRTLNYLGCKVSHVINITDVGHMTDDADEGVDKLEKKAEHEKKSVKDIAKFYTDNFTDSIQKLNIIPADTIALATEHIDSMIDLIKKLEEKAFVYETTEAVYFDTSKFKNYGKLSGQALQDKMQQSRDDVHVDPDKKNKEDFVLWFKLTGKHKNHTMRWSSPWGEGFPGWHIECSAMSMEYLGETIDIHAGGVDHIAVHHENEIAQSECATNKPFVNHWFHSEFLKVNGTKMSKSLKNIYTIEDIQKKNIDPLSLRYLYLQTHYRKVLNFTWEALTGAQQALYNLRELIVQMKKEDRRTELSEDKLQKIQEFARTFNQALANDLQIPQALSIIWQVTKSNIPSPDKLDLISEYDKVLGLDLISVKEDAVPASVIKLADERLKARKLGDFKTADRLRKQIMQLGYKLKDTPEGYKISKLRSKHIA